MHKCKLCKKVAHVVENKEYYCASCALTKQRKHETSNRLRDKQSLRKTRQNSLYCL